MNTEKQRIAIAEACGWEKQAREEIWWNKNKCRYAILDELPDYLSDLNAMHEAEETLSENKQEYFESFLQGIANSGINAEEAETHDFYWSVIHATAEERAEAFLKTIGRWEDE